VHRPFGNVPLLVRFFDVSVPSHGDGCTVNVGQHHTSEAQQPFAHCHTASLRAIYDLADLEQSRSVYQTRQSGIVFSLRYRARSAIWAQTGYPKLHSGRSAAPVHALTGAAPVLKHRRAAGAGPQQGQIKNTAAAPQRHDKQEKKMGFVPLIEVQRGGLAECQHWGAVAVANRQGQVLAQAGDPYAVTFTRSTIKAFQALPLMQSGAVQALGWGPSELALLCASHNGEAMHVERVQSMLDSVGLGHQALRCGCHAPLFASLGLPGLALPAGQAVDERHNNCSGKHAGFLAYCVHRGLPLEGHLDPAHPLQVAVRASVAQAVGLAPDQLHKGTDGCSAPNYAMPLAHLAQGYARLAGGAPGTELHASLTALADAMVGQPELGSGTGRHDLDFMRVGQGDWVSKTGADGVQVLGSRSRGEAFALKIMDGNMTAQVAAAVEVLDQLGWLNGAQRSALAPRRSAVLLSALGRPVGERKPVFKLSGVNI
jgi:L-asparaginase II